MVFWFLVRGFWFFFFSSRRRHTRWNCDRSSDVCSSDLRRSNPDSPGFDSNPARRDLATANFLRVMESGLGGTKDNFDTISFHTLPNPRSPAELWPDLSQDEQARQQEHFDRVARENPAYAELGGDVCGRAALTGKSV